MWTKGQKEAAAGRRSFANAQDDRKGVLDERKGLRMKEKKHQASMAVTRVE